VAAARGSRFFSDFASLPSLRPTRVDVVGEADEPDSEIGAPPVAAHNTHAHSAWAVAAEVSRERARSNGARRRSMIHLPLLCPSRRGASGVHLRRILTRCRRVRLAHLILRNCCADGGARTSVRRSARMGLVGCDGQPKIAIREQGRFPVKGSSDRDFLSTLVTSGTPCHGGMIAPMRFRLASPQALVCALPGRSAHESTTVSSALSI
jgi:hypothetical protein